MSELLQPHHATPGFVTPTLCLARLGNIHSLLPLPLFEATRTEGCGQTNTRLGTDHLFVIRSYCALDELFLFAVPASDVGTLRLSAEDGFVAGKIERDCGSLLDERIDAVGLRVVERVAAFGTGSFLLVGEVEVGVSKRAGSGALLGAGAGSGGAGALGGASGSGGVSIRVRA